MKEIIKNICDITVKNYKLIRDEFRFDGDYINHFASIVYSNGQTEIPTDNIKKIRTYIKSKKGCSIWGNPFSMCDSETRINPTALSCHFQSLP